MDIPEKLFVLGLLVLVNAFFAAGEIALVSANDARLRVLAERGDQRARLVLKNTQNSTKLLATIQVVLTLASFFTSATAAQGLVGPLEQLLRQIPWLGDRVYNSAFVLITLMSALVTLVLGELVPKRIALRHPEQAAILTIIPIAWLGRLAGPVILWISQLTNLLLRLSGNHPDGPESPVSVEEVRAMVDAALLGGAVGEQERRIIHGAVELSQITVRAIMVPRVQIQYLKATTSLEEAFQVASENAHTRLPVCHEDLDTVLGILHVKDLIRPLGELLTHPPSLGELLRPVCYVSESKLATDLLAEMQRNRLHMAIVRDEFGGTAGLVTLEDILEEIVGEIRDEYDAEEEREFRRLGDHAGIFKIRASLARVNNELEVRLPREEAATLAGLFMRELDRPPEPGDRLEIDHILLEVLADGLRVRVTRLSPGPEEDI